MILVFWGKILSSKQILICKYVEQQTLSVYFCLDGGFYLNSQSSWNWHLVLVPHSRNEHRISLHLSLILLSTYFPYPITNKANPCYTNACDTLLFSLRCMWVKSSLLIAKVLGGNSWIYFKKCRANEVEWFSWLENTDPCTKSRKNKHAIEI